ncbi:MAG: SUMF1/EgtB/PvdO family nonheme iron enzyme, partial [Verrucomicrobiota bacterium]
MIPSFTRIPPGIGLIGGHPDDKFVLPTELPRHDITFPDPFWLTQTAITVEQWNESRLFPPRQGDPKLPVVRVSWEEANDYAHWLGKRLDIPCRLPTEEEWEYSARGGITAPFPKGDSLSLEEANYLYSEQRIAIGLGRMTTVTSYPPNSWGLYDMLGNTNEWCSSLWRPDYASPSHPNEVLRSVRGGAWDYVPR